MNINLFKLLDLFLFMVDDLKSKLESNVYTSFYLFRKDHGVNPSYAILTPTVFSLLDSNGLLETRPMEESQTHTFIRSRSQVIQALNLSDIPKEYRDVAIQVSSRITTPLILCYTGRVFKNSLRGISAYALDADPGLLRQAG